MNDIYKQIYKKINKARSIVIARHVGADPDALGSQLGLKAILQETFPDKKIYAVGTPASRFKFMGLLDRMSESLYETDLLIVLDTPDLRRVDSVDVLKFKECIKIDHHPLVDNFNGLEWIDDQASSASQMIATLCQHTKLVLTDKAAKNLFMGIVSDTNRFLYSYTNTNTFATINLGCVCAIRCLADSIVDNV